MTKKLKTALLQASLEPLRLLAIALIPVLLVYFQGLSYEWAGLLIVLLRWLDKILYKVGKVTKGDTGGLVRF